MTTMVERMARALEPELFALEDAARAKGDPLALKCFAWQYAEAVSRAHAKALAALRELREPTEVMVEAALVELPDVWDGPWNGVASDAFTAAVDAEIAAYEASR